ncbi:MAG TPA: 16S rRNA (uracil(1498)-N(3))-methyltransferase, partial [Rhodoferax sp.]
MPRFYCPTSLRCGDLLDLPASAARHVQVLRLQPGDSITLFNGGPGWDEHDSEHPQGGEFEASVTRMGRSDVQVQVGAYHALEREAAHQVHLAVGMPANERMDWLVEKATELGVASIQPLMTERSVLRLNPERAGKKQAHWQSVAVAACEQCGGNRVPVVHAVMTFAAWIKARPTQARGQRLLLSLRSGAQGVRAAVNAFANPASAPGVI